MNTNLLKERKARIRKAFSLEKPDRTPVVLMADAFCATHMGVKLSDFCSSLTYSNQVMVDSMKELQADAICHVTGYAPIMPLSFMSRVKLPGVNLPDNALWQLDEQEMMTTEDYDIILNKGWMPFMTDYMENRLKIQLEPLFAELAEWPQYIRNFENNGTAVLTPVNGTVVYELLNGGRSMPSFVKDLYKIPDKVEAVLDVIQKETSGRLRHKIHEVKPEVVFLSPARGASEFFGPKLWQRFVWKYLKATADVIIEEGADVCLHLDAHWERDLEFFRAFPKGRCLFDTDGATDIYKIKAVLGDIMAIKGDVPAAMLALGTPDDVYNYSTRLIEDMGPGFILSSGCSIPPNAKVENVKAMISAATGK
ncbi:uroporphyrinogen decarboxylase family protein [Sporomusa termitida]|uniref:uroporphyrinogen decarboxylase family protein n=1 Tax=Sporomusa termitida TaxID=2377 RepID=UPI001FEB8AEF|nr:uroporphyrinogen decarboxylase family protein [Sporomusa termitida]